MTLYIVNRIAINYFLLDLRSSLENWETDLQGILSDPVTYEKLLTEHNNKKYRILASVLHILILMHFAKLNPQQQSGELSSIKLNYNQEYSLDDMYQKMIGFKVLRPVFN